MKNVLVGLLFCSPLIGFAQAATVGDWRSSTVDEKGNPATFKVSLKADGTYAVDFEEDGTIDIEGKYSIEGDQMTIEDTGGPAACKDGKGTYKFVTTETTNTLTEVTDPCDRSGPAGKIVFTRIQ